MKLKISRVVEIEEDYKSSNDIISEILKSKDEFIEYRLESQNSTDKKLVFENTNHRKMLHKYLMFEHFYLLVLLAPLIFLMSLFSDNIIMIILGFSGVLFVPYKFIYSNQVPHKLFFEGLNIYETNYLKRRVEEIYPSQIGSLYKSDEEVLYITSLKTSRNRNEKMKALVIIKASDENGNIDILKKHFQKFNVKIDFK